MRAYLPRVTQRLEKLRPPLGPNRTWALRAAVLGLFVAAMGLIWVTNQILSQRFSESSRARSDVRLALYSGNLIGELERQEVVPLLLSRDPLLLGALSSQDFVQTSQLLIKYRDEIGAARLMLLDSSGRVVASSERSNLGQNQRSAPYFIEALRSSDTIYTAMQTEAGATAFFYSRRVGQSGDTLGVIAVEVDLRKFLPRWAWLSDAVFVLDSTGRVVLSTTPRWTGLTEADFLETTVSSTEGFLRGFAGAAADGYVDGEPMMRQETRVPFQGWRLVSYTSFAQVRERVAAVLAMEVMGFAIVLALLFYLVSQSSNRRSARLARESDRLRRLNQRLQAEIAERERAERSLQVAEQSLAQSSKMAALGEMAAAVSHELNQPLAAMKTYLAGARLLMQRQRTEEALSSFHRINGLIDRMGSITRQLKAHARKETDELSEVDLRDCVTSVMDMMAPQLSRSPARISRTVPEHPVLVMADPVRIEQVLVNLLRNALDATAGAEEPMVDIVLSQGDVATLSVRDNGSGISDLKNLFEPFYTTKPPGEGVGLGLAISSTIVKSFGGRLTARNGSGGGAIFKMDLPLMGDPDVSEPQARSGQPDAAAE
ncbi:ATP-binding protein [Mangrovicoccus sp. HB161399]|uniref:sensor histidine kinase n=1 Tax=Mangrovicoccus sp. HB161399 TaxID=2720392 RepID=UPI001551D58A|nr:ATP-binding protein [Mangrovicoccus sp. HB161399]